MYFGKYILPEGGVTLHEKFRACLTVGSSEAKGQRSLHYVVEGMILMK